MTKISLTSTQLSRLLKKQDSRIKVEDLDPADFEVGSPSKTLIPWQFVNRVIRLENKARAKNNDLDTAADLRPRPSK